VQYEEKAVNTRSQGVTVTTTTTIPPAHSGDEDVTDNSLMARRRRRRERAQTAYIMHAGQSASLDGQLMTVTDGIRQQQTELPANTVIRFARLTYNCSVEIILTHVFIVIYL